MERKSFSLGEIKALGDIDEPGTFEAVAAVFGNVDHGGDRIQRGAFKRSLAEWARKGRSVPVLWSHDAEQVPIGVVKEAQETREGLHVKAQLLVDDHPQARAVYAAMKAGALHEFSFGYGVRDKAVVVEHGKEIRVLKDLDLGEISPVFRGMNPETRLMGVKAMVQQSDRCPSDMPHAVMDGDRVMACHATAASAQMHADAMTDGKALADALTDAVQDLAEVADDAGDWRRSTDKLEITDEAPSEEGAEHEDKPDPNAQGAEEERARIGRLLAERPIHTQETDA